MSAAVSAAPIIGVFPSISPDWVLSPGSFAAYEANALFALEHNLAAWGTPDTPGYYERTWAYTSNDVIGTDFYSWRGQVPPPLGFATETGNGLLFGMYIRGAGDRFTIADITYDENFFGSTATRNLGATRNFGSDLVGLDYGPDGIPGTPDDIRYAGTRPDAATLLLDEVYFVGYGVQFYVADYADWATWIDTIRRADPNDAMGTYSVLGSSVTASATLSDAIPEPATIVLIGVGLLFIGAAGRKGRKN
jgi:hypothetical protein